MKYDFDRVIPRAGTGATKWGVIQDEDNPARVSETDVYTSQDPVLAMWVADMDFTCPPEVIAMLMARAKHGVYGYTYRTPSYTNAVVGWMKERHNWDIKPEWISTCPGVVAALNLIVRGFCAPGVKVIVQPPVYYPFYSAVENNGATLARNPLIYEDGRYRMDFAGLEKIAQEPGVKLALLCSPHNPVGRVWHPDELLRFGEICLRNNILVISDELHGDLILPGNQFVPFATLSEEFAQNSIICTAPSKTFNLAGLKTSNMIIPNPQLREKFDHMVQISGLSGLNAFGAIAVEAAYTEGGAWLDAMLEYLASNLNYLENYLTQYVPEIQVVKPEGTYLVWLDCRRLELDDKGLRHLLLEDARVYMDAGNIFGEQGAGFQRMNIACPRSILVRALEKIRHVVKHHNSKKG